MNDEMPHDDQLRALYRKLPADEPRAQLDDAILAAARKRTRESARLQVLRRVRWSVSLAAAAGLVLTLTLNRFASEPELKRSDVSQAQFTEHAHPAGDPAMAAAPAPATSPAPAAATLDALEDRDARRADAPAAAAMAEKAEADAANARKQESQPLAKDIDSGRARAKADSAPPVAEPRREMPGGSRPKSPMPEAFARADGATAPRGDSGSAAAPAPEVPSAAARSRLQSLGYMRGGDEAAAPAPPPSGSGVADEADDAVACEAAPEVPAAPPEPWPFGLEPGLAPEEACRRVKEAIHQDCRFLAGFVDMPITPAAKVDRGRLSGASASHLTMSLQRDKLWSVILRIASPDGSFTTADFTAPGWMPAPAPAPESVPAPTPGQ